MFFGPVGFFDAVYLFSDDIETSRFCIVLTVHQVLIVENMRTLSCTVFDS